MMKKLLAVLVIFVMCGAASADTINTNPAVQRHAELQQYVDVQSV